LRQALEVGHRHNLIERKIHNQVLCTTGAAEALSGDWFILFRKKPGLFGRAFH
jgi:hypothetical protein